VLAVDEDPDDLLIRLAQIAGFTVTQAESRDPNLLAQIDEALKPLHIRLYDSTQTIESAARDLAPWARSRGKQAVLCIDSLQAVRSELQQQATSTRELVEANVAAIRRVSTEHRLLVISTSEANRAAYRLRKPGADEQNDLAAGAESRTIEFSAQTLLVLRTPPDHPDIVHVRVAKNRGATRGVEFWLQLDRERHSLRECAEPPKTGSSESAAPMSAERRMRALRSDAVALADLVEATPHLSERGLRDAVKPLHWGVARLDGAKQYLQDHGVNGLYLRNAGSSRLAEWELVRRSEVDE
jgi:hypothetical protein